MVLVYQHFQDEDFPNRFLLPDFVSYGEMWGRKQTKQAARASTFLSDTLSDRDAETNDS